MRILLINHFPLTGSGSGVYTQNIANSLIRKGHEVCIIFPENEPTEDNNSFKVHPVYFKNEIVIPGQLSFNFPCFTTHPRSTQTFYDLPDEGLNCYKSAFKDAIEYEIENFKPDIIHAGHIWLLASIAADYDIPLIITAHGTDLIGYQKSEMFRAEAEYAAEKAISIITISKENSDLVNETFSFAKEKNILIPNGYDPNVFYLEKSDKKETLGLLGIEQDYKNVVSFVGKFTYFKGIDILLKAAKIYGNSNTITLLAGDGGIMDEMQDLAKQLNLSNIKFLKNQPHEVLRKIYNIADVSLVPSRNEAFGLVVIEANACGTPVIGTNDGGIPDIITAETGILFEKENYRELAECVLKVLNGTVTFEREEVAKITQDKYSQDEFVDQLVSIYEDGLTKKLIQN